MTNSRWARRYFDEAVLLDTDRCILWPYANNGRYGQLGNSMVHILACTLEHGPRPDGLQVRHLCGHTLCFNRRHLRWGTALENGRDQVEQGTQARGERQGRARLTKVDVLAIRASDETADVLAARYGLHPQYVRQIRKRRTWTHI